MFTLYYDFAFTNLLSMSVIYGLIGLFELIGVPILGRLIWKQRRRMFSNPLFARNGMEALSNIWSWIFSLRLGAYSGIHRYACDYAPSDRISVASIHPDRNRSGRASGIYSSSVFC